MTISYLLRNNTILFFLVLIMPLHLRAQELLHELDSSNGRNLGYFGGEVLGVGDLDSDGHGDLVIGAWSEDVGSVTGAGRVYVLSGATGLPLGEITSPNIESGGYFGFAASNVPDTDGDGHDDLLVGAYNEDIQSGRAYLFSGATGALLHELQSPAPALAGAFGSSVSGIGDLDGDGRGDLLVGAAGEGSPISFLAGRVYAFSGATGALLFTLASPNPDPNSHFGLALGSVSDTDGDGRDDILAGAWAEPVGASGLAGRAYVFSGDGGALLYELESPNSQTDGRFGNAVSGTSDLDGDGRGDLVVGAYGESDFAGRAYVFSGSDGALLHTLISPTPEPDGSFGTSVAAVPDLDGDGRDDLLVGASGEGPGASPDGAGRVHAFSGAGGAALFTLASPNEQEGGAFGAAVAGVPDTDGDGRGDVLVGAYFEAPSGGSEATGRAYLFSGGTAGSGLGLTVTPTSPLGVAPGGAVSFAYAVANATSQAVSGDLFFAAERGGAIVASGVIASGSVPAGRTVSGTFMQRVPGGAPAGAYTYAVSIGDYPASALASEVFTAEVTGAQRSAKEGAWSTTAAGWGQGGSASGTGSAAAVTVSPNPFAERAEVAFALDTPGEVSLVVYDVRGRAVAGLASGAFGAGAHAVALEAGTWPSGVYVWRLVAGGRVETGRVTVVR